MKIPLNSLKCQCEYLLHFRISLLSILFYIHTLGQVAKLERHLSLLRQEYVKLQNKHIELEQKYSLAVAASGQTGEHENTFVSRLLKTVAELFDKDLYRCVSLFMQSLLVNRYKH